MPHPAGARRNGWERPRSPRQALAICIWALNALLYAAVPLQLLSDAALAVLTAGFALAWLLTGVFATLVMMADPCDPRLYEAEAEAESAGRQMAHCYRCECHVDAGSRHCFDCGKCVAGFDHHCPWLNTCIGMRNYRLFLATIWALLGQLTFFVAALAASAAQAWQEDLGAFGVDDSRFSLALVAVCAALYVPCWCATAFLVAFHLFLTQRGFTTYEYLTGKEARPARAPPREASAEKEMAAAPAGPEAEVKTPTALQDDGSEGASAHGSSRDLPARSVSWMSQSSLASTRSVLRIMASVNFDEPGPMSSRSLPGAETRGGDGDAAS